jgi:hypothetical protein
MAKALSIASLAGVAFLLGGAVGQQLQPPPDQGYWTVSRVIMPRSADRDSLRAIMKESAGVRVEALKRSGISRYWLVEYAGGNGAQVLVLTRYPSWVGVQDTILGFNSDAYRRTMPDSAKRMAWVKRWRDLMASAPSERSLWREIAGPDR